MFWNKKRKKGSYDFDNDDRSLSDLRKKIKKTELKILAAKLRKMNKEADAVYDDGHKSPAREMLKQVRDLDMLREYMTPEQEEAGGGIEESILKMILEQKKQESKIPDDIQNATKGRQEPPDLLSLAEANLPKAVKLGVRSGVISKEKFKDEARKFADAQADALYKRLKAGKTKK